jgi:GTPase SAR1 family protein
VPLIYGEFGVGKTSMVRRLLGDSRSVLYVPTASGKTMTSIFGIALERLDYETTTKHTEGREVGGSGGLDVIVAKAGASATVRHESERQLVVQTPTDQKVLEVLARAGITLIVDEMHRATARFRDEIADFIKAANGMSQDFPKVVLVGTTSDPELLVSRDPGIDRIVKEIQVRPLTRDEAEYIIRQGFKKLGILISGELVDKIVRTAAGAPNIVQSLCLDMADASKRNNRTFVLSGDFSTAINGYVSQAHNQRLVERYMRAIETTGAKRYRKQILHAMAKLEKDLVPLDDIRAGVSAQLGEDVPSESLSGPLKDLKDDRYGKLLKDVDRKEGDRVFNLSRFSDPTMKYFIRFLEELEKQDLMPKQSGRLL